MKGLTEVINEVMEAKKSKDTRTIIFEWDDELLQRIDPDGAVKEYRDTILKDHFIKMVSNMLRLDFLYVPFETAEDKHKRKSSYTYTFQMLQEDWDDFAYELEVEVEVWVKRLNKKHGMYARLNPRPKFGGIQIICPTNNTDDSGYYLNIKYV